MSKQVLLERGLMTTDDLRLRLFGRTFGAVMKDADRFQQPMPDFFQPIVNELQAASAILKLDIGANEDAIFAAYKHDVFFLQKRLNQLQSWVKACIEASVKPTDINRDAHADRVALGWGFVQKHIPLIAEAPLIDLPAERAALPADQLLAELKQEVVTGIDSMMKRFSLWLDLLVAKEYVGIVHFTGPTVGHYYYFRPYTTDKVDVTNRSEITVDLSVPFGEQTTYTDSERRKYRITESVERHDHHIVRAKTEPLVDYAGLIPDRIIKALESAPEWLRPHLRVVSGDITKEVVARRVVREQEEIHERVTSTYKGSPAIALGSYALNGWSSDDTRSEPCGFFRDQEVYSPAKRASVWHSLKVTALMAAIIALIVGGIWYFVAASNRESAEAYQAYHQQYSAGREILTLEQSAMITLPGGQPLYYLGKFQQFTAGDTFIFATDPKVAWQPGARQGNMLPKRDGDIHYGTIDLGQMGIPALMHILRGDKMKVQFTIDYYIK